jgi:hypothetical protein
MRHLGAAALRPVALSAGSLLYSGRAGVFHVFQTRQHPVPSSP